MITTTLKSSSFWKTLVHFCLLKKRPEKAFLTITVNCCNIAQKNKLSFKTAIGYLMIYDVLVIGCFDWKIGVFQQTVVMVYYILNLSLDLTWLHVQRLVWLYRWKPLILSRHLAIFACHRTCGSRDTTNLNFRLIMQNHVIKGLCDFMEGNSLLSISNMPRLVPIGIAVTDI